MSFRGSLTDGKLAGISVLMASVFYNNYNLYNNHNNTLFLSVLVNTASVSIFFHLISKEALIWLLKISMEKLYWMLRGQSKINILFIILLCLVKYENSSSHGFFQFIQFCQWPNRDSLIFYHITFFSGKVH